MQFLIRSEWLELEARERAIEISDARVKEDFAKARKQAFPDDKAYAKFLKDSGQTEDDLLFRQRSQLLEVEISDQVVGSVGRVTLDEMRAFYKRSKGSIGAPGGFWRNRRVIRDAVAQLKRDKALTSFGKIYQRKWRAETECQERFIVSDCSNYRAPKS